MSKGKIKEIFLGGNTSLGFFSYYDYILEQGDANKIVVIKGGPGVGKSTFMKKIGQEAVERGLDVELMHCSSDNNSLDGVLIAEKKIAFVDGTAPHIVDPKNPGAVDEILNLGEYWNEDGIRENKDLIINCNTEIGRTFNRAYKYLRAARALYDDTKIINERAMSKEKLNAISQELICDIFDRDGISIKEGKERKLFASSITPNGLVNYLHTILPNNKVYKVKGQNGTGTEELLIKIKNAAIERGYSVESYYCAFNPEKLEHLVIFDKNIAFTTTNEYHNTSVESEEVIDLDQYLDEDILKENEKDLYFNKFEFDKLIERAITTIKRAKILHDELEEYYIPNMNFEDINVCYKKTIEKILD